MLNTTLKPIKRSQVLGLALCAVLFSAGLTSSAMAELEIDKDILNCIGFYNLREKSHCVIKWIKFGKQNLNRAMFVGFENEDKDWSGKTLREAMFKESNFSETNFTGVDFTRAVIVSVNFKGANLTKANFTKAQVSGSDMTGANLTGANLEEARFDKVNLEKAIVTSATVNLKTKGIDFEDWKKRGGIVKNE